MQVVAIRMPQLGEAIAEATVKAWLAEPETMVEEGQNLIEVETEKAALPITAPATGRLRSRVAVVGETYQVGDLLGEIEADHVVPAVEAALPQALPTGSGAGRRAVFDEQADLAVRGSGDSGVGWLSPRVRTLMAAQDLRPDDLLGVPGSGLGGRLTGTDVERFIAETRDQPGVEAGALRRAVADSMRRSWMRPLAFCGCEVSIEPLLAHRHTIAARPAATVYGLRALALALVEDDRLARRLIGRRLVRPTSIDLSLAVATEEGVRTPSIRGVDKTDLATLTQMVHRVTEEAARGPIIGDPSARAVSTLTNYGTLGITWATPLPPPDQSCILGIGSVKVVPVWNPKAERWDRGRACELILCFDHRVADGDVAGRLLRRVARYLERPESLV